MPSDSQRPEDCDVEDVSAEHKKRRKRRRRRIRRFLKIIKAIEFVARAAILGIFQSLLCALVGQAVLRAAHLPGYDSYLPLSMAIGAAGGGPVFAMAFTLHRNFISEERIILQKNKTLFVLNQAASFVLLIHVAGGALVVGACALGVLMLRHVLPESMDASHAACAGLVGYSILTGPLMVIATILFLWYDLHNVFPNWSRRWSASDNHDNSATETPSLPPPQATSQSEESPTVPA
ncbi:hypothetical protein BU15DRAFT_72189 [Melanogaster broomeanus]|nr:hypothetical protein BU15DRAFT_72189 [Melanogaster broomeanus]